MVPLPSEKASAAPDTVPDKPHTKSVARGRDVTVVCLGTHFFGLSCLALNLKVIVFAKFGEFSTITSACVFLTPCSFSLWDSDQKNAGSLVLLPRVPVAL